MDFITGLPMNWRQHDSIMVVVDKLTKATHFIPVKSTHQTDDFCKDIHEGDIQIAWIAEGNSF